MCREILFDILINKNTELSALYYLANNNKNARKQLVQIFKTMLYKKEYAYLETGRINIDNSIIIKYNLVFNQTSIDKLCQNVLQASIFSELVSEFQILLHLLFIECDPNAHTYSGILFRYYNYPILYMENVLKDDQQTLIIELSGMRNSFLMFYKLYASSSL